MTQAAPAAPFDELIGLNVVAASPDVVVTAIALNPNLCQPYGITHGAVYCGIVESTASIGADMWARANGASTTVGVANQTDFLRSTRTGALQGRATPIHRGSSQQLWQVEITDDNERLVARGQVRFNNLHR